MCYEWLHKARNQSNHKATHQENSHQGLYAKLAYLTEMSMSKTRFMLGIKQHDLCVFGSGSGTGFGCFMQL